MNWSKGFLIFSLFVLGAALIYFVVVSSQLRNVAKPEVTAEPNEEQATEGSGIGKQNVFSEAADQTSEEHVAVESEDDAETADDTLVDLIADSLTDDTELQETSETLSPEVKLKVERYAALAKLLPVIEELRHEKFLVTKASEKFVDEHYRELRGQVRRGERDPTSYPEPDPVALAEYSQIEQAIDEDVKDYQRQIGDMFPELDVIDEEDGFLFINRQVLREYFGRKLPWDGKSDYFSAPSLD